MLNILIVDDEHHILNGCRFMIEDTLNLPFEVHVMTANNVPAAKDILKEVDFDLILTDIRMPVMDGFSLIAYIREQEISGDVVILTSHADFDYALKALRVNVTDFILKPISEESLFQTITKCFESKNLFKIKQMDDFYMKVMTMMLYDVSAHDLLLTDATLEELFPFSYFTVIIIALDGENANVHCLEQLLSKYYNRCHCYMMHEQKQLAAICNHRDFFVRPSTLREKLHQSIGFHAITGISISANSIHKLHSLYMNARQRIFYAKTYGENEALSEAAFYSYQNCVKIFLENDKEKMHALIVEFMDQMHLIDTPSPSYLTQIYKNFFHNILLYLENIGIEYSLSLPSELFDLCDVSALTKHIVERLVVLKDHIQKEYSEGKNESLVKLLLTFISNHYSEDISLDDLSAAVNLHPNYVSSFFKKATGQSYLTCLHKERILAAKNMLTDSTLSIESIASAVGYNSSTQFARIFRKYENISPSDFRNS